MPDTNIGMTIEFLAAYGDLGPKDMKAVKETVAALTSGDETRGLRAHRIEHPSGRIVSYSATMSVRVLVYQEGAARTLLYVDRHDEAYEWASRRRFIFGGSELRVLVSSSQPDAEKPPLRSPRVAATSPEPSPLETFRAELNRISDEDQAIAYIAGLPIGVDEQEKLFEVLLQRSSGLSLLPRGSVAILESDEDLQRALDYPLDLWRVFLHPSQREVAHAPIDHSAILTGGPGTGKTVCIVHRVKHLVDQLRSDEVIVLTTYKNALADYIERMLEKLAVDRDRVVIADVSAFRILESEPGAKKMSGFFLISRSGLEYLEQGRRRKVRHVLFDEYQDFKSSELNGIGRLIEAAPYTFAFDYTQAIYRPPREAVQKLMEGRTSELVRLTKCYRLNARIVSRLRRLVSAIRVLALHSANSQGRVEMMPLEEELVGSMSAVLDGPSPILVPYSSESDLQAKLNGVALELAAWASPNEAVVTRFASDIYKTLQEVDSYGNEGVCESARPFFRHVATLKGKEFRQGVVVLDETICQMLNLNHNVFGRRIDTGWKGKAETFRLGLNLLYVALSRFRDGLTVMFPSRFSAVIEPLLGD